LQLINVSILLSTLLWFFIVRDKIYKLRIYSMLDNMLITLFIKKPTKKVCIS